MSIRQRPTSRRAFSLAELVTVILLIAIAAAIAMPRYGAALRNYRVSAAARRLAADLAYAQSLAKSSSSTFTVYFNPSTSSYQLAAATGPTTQIAGATGSVNGNAAYLVLLQSDPFQATIASFSLSSGKSVLSFNGFGVPDAGGTIVLQCGSAQKTLNIDADTGAVVIQ